MIRGDGENLIDFMYVDDAVDGFLALVRAEGVRLTVDFASGTPVSINDIVAAMAANARRRGHAATRGPASPEYIEFRSADSTMRDRFGVAPAISFDDGLERLSNFLS